MSTYNGTVYVVTVDGNLIGSSRSATLTRTVETIDTTTKDSGGNSEHIQGVRSWEGSFEGLYDPSDTYTIKEIYDLMSSRTGCTILFQTSTADAGSLSFTGSASFTSIELSAPYEDVVGWSASFTGNGALTVTELT